MAALIGDILEQRVSVREANAVCAAGGLLLKVAVMRERYGTSRKADTPRQKLMLVEDEPND